MSDTTTIELKNIDPEDISDVLQKVEKSFGFKFDDTELKNKTQRKVRIVTQNIFSRNIYFRVLVSQQFSRKRNFSTKFIDKVRFGFQFSHKIFR